MKRRAFRYSSSPIALDNNKAHKFAQVFAVNIFRKQAIFTWIPKNACSTMRLSIAMWNGCIDSISEGHWIHSNNYTFSADLKSLAEADYTFTVLRCPFRRVASLFLDKLTLSSPEGDSFRRRLLGIKTKKKSMNIKLLNKISKLYKNNYDSMDKTLDITFKQFVEKLQDDTTLHKDAHWRPQVDFMIFKDYDEYFSLEKFHTTRGAILDRLGLEICDARSLTKHGTTHLHKLSGKYSSASIKDIQDMKKEGFIPSYESLYTDYEINIIHSIYMNDFRMYKGLFGSQDLLFNL